MRAIQVSKQKFQQYAAILSEASHVVRYQLKVFFSLRKPTTRLTEGVDSL